METIRSAYSYVRGGSDSSGRLVPVTAEVYSVETKERPEVAGEGKARVSAFAAHTKEFPKTSASELRTLSDNFAHGVSVGANRPFLGHRPVTNGVAGPYIWLSYAEVAKRVHHLGSGLRGLVPMLETTPLVGLFSINRADWVIADQACHIFGLTTVPMLDMLSQDAIIHILNETQLSTLIASREKAKLILGMLSTTQRLFPHLTHMILMDPPDEEALSLARVASIHIYSMSEVERRGASTPILPNPPLPDSLASICYTSGTTGVPKGTMLTHENMLSLLKGVFVLEKLGRFVGLRDDDVYISYLPLAHVFERSMINCLIHVGAAVGFFQGDTLKLMDDVSELRPTIFPSVPRLYNRIYDKIRVGVKKQGAVMGEILFSTALDAKMAQIRQGGPVTHAVWDRIVFAGIQARLGGRVRIMLTGAAPISPRVKDFMRICFSVQMYEGYGLTETCSSLSITDGLDYTSHNVGAPAPGLEVKLIDIPEMGYFSTDKPHPRGEICVRGPSVFKGYFKNPEQTAKVLDSNGWFRTGDVGKWDEEGRLVIIDRKKSIFKLSQAEYIAPEKIENILRLHPLVSQAFIYGDSLKSCIVGVIHPDRVALLGWATKTMDTYNKTLADVCSNDAVRKALLKSLEEHGRAHGLKGFENVKSIWLSVEPFSVENGLLTPVYKLRRFQARERFKAEIEAMYHEFGN
ncbi:hypothetical protein BC830DRAFT_1170444 [Chytriomyces sp. MP71]|nr:hypothetical protein BC830DRAFT_1170444 [Chytriomyces sp. MP71]